MEINGVSIGDALAIHAEFSSQLAGRYFLFAVLGFIALWVIAKTALRSGRPNPPGADRRQLTREALWSLSTILIAGAIAPIVLVAGAGPLLNFYSDVDDYGWAYFLLSVPLMMVLRDTYYYWGHRLLHTPRFFRLAHRTHHLSHRVTPLTGFSVSPLECLILSVIPYTLILFLLPKHPAAYLFYVWLDAAVAVYTHFGFETFPRGFSRHWFGRWIVTSTAHQGHHRNARCNHGLYFLFWDRWMGTLDKDYDKQFDIAVGLASKPQRGMPVVARDLKQ